MQHNQSNRVFGEGEFPPSAWAKKVAKAIGKSLFGEEGPPNKKPVSESVLDEDSPDIFGNNVGGQTSLWQVFNDRKVVYTNIEHMDHNDELVSTALDVVADCTLAYDEIASEEDDEVVSLRSTDANIQRILDNFSRRVNLQEEAWQIIRECVKHGNVFREIILDKDKTQIDRIKQTLGYTVWPKLTDKGDKIPGWIIHTDTSITSGKGKELEEWQIAPFIFGERRGYLAVPPLASARKNWMRLMQIEDSMGIARLTRCYDRLVHRVPVQPNDPPEEGLRKLRSYKNSMTKKKITSSSGQMNLVDNPMTSNTDIFMPDDGSGKGGVEVLNFTNNQLANLNDVYYSREKTLARLKVPISYLQIMSSIKTHTGKKGSDEQNQFARYLKRVQATFKQSLRRIINIELALHGIPPSQGSYKIVMTRINTRNLKDDAETLLTYGQAAAYFVEAFGSIPLPVLQECFLELTPAQKAMFEEFAKKDGKKIETARVKAIEENAKPKSSSTLGPSKDRIAAGGETGSGNNNKTKAARSTEQSVDLEMLTEAFVSLQETINARLIDAGADVPSGQELKLWTREALIEYGLANAGIDA